MMNSLKRLRKSFSYAWSGLVFVFRTQPNMRIHVCIAFAAVLLSVVLSVPKAQFVLVIFAIVFVMCMEVLNTAVEQTINMITDQYHPLAKIVKDVAAGAVLLAAIFAFIIGAYVFLPPLLEVVYSNG